MENNLETLKNQTEALTMIEKNRKGGDRIQGFLMSRVNTLAYSVDDYLNYSKDSRLITKRVEVLFDWIEGKMAISR